MRYLCLISFILLLSGCRSVIYYPSDVKEALERLDVVISNKEIIENQKENRIKNLRNRICSLTDGQELYGVYDNLFHEYFQYNIDSAYFYAHRKIELARAIDNPTLLKDAFMDITERYTMSGFYDATLSIFEECGDAWSTDLRYLSTLNTVYSNLEASSNDKVLAAKYKDLKDLYRNDLISSLNENDISRFFIQTEILLEDNRNSEVLDLLLPYLKEHEPSLENQGIIFYTIARAYSMLADIDNAILWYAKSAESDLLVPKYEYRSLYELASLLYKKNDIERAYTYITRFVDDAMQANAQFQKQFSYELLPVISNAYNHYIEQKGRTIKYAFLISLLFLILLVFLAVVLVKERARAKHAEMQTKEINARLQKLTEELEQNVQILKETNQVKNLYLGRYLSLCSEYIDGLENYRASIRKVVKEGGDLAKVLKSKEFMEKTLSEFYSQFDTTFLDLFPDFIPQLNELLQEENRISYSSKDRSLTTELRVIALIRLGVNDSVKIARFLRRSVSTVYNYRVKMRNASICDRENFENRLMQIGR